MWDKLLDRILPKLLSGRFLFTLGALLVFIVLSITGKLPIDKIQEVILIVIYAYFSRQDRQLPK